MILRPNAKNFSAASRKAFTDAILAMKKRPSRLHPGSADRSRYDDYVEVHLNAMSAMMIGNVPNWGHLSSAFGPWHRVFLAHFESELRAIDPVVVLPYWDWTDPASTAAVFSPGMLGGDGQGEDHRVNDGPFTSGAWKIVVKDDEADPSYLTRQFGVEEDAPQLPTAKEQDDVMALTVYDEAPWYDSQRRAPFQRVRTDALFRFRLEYDLHNLVHRYVGGDMGRAASPNDPVFWLHHCNLDRLWSLWEQTMAGKAEPYEPRHNGPAGQSGDKPLIFHFANSIAPWLGDSKPEDVYDSRGQLAIGYDTDLPAALPPAGTREFMAPGMKMSAREMYPLRKEFKAGAGHHRMFPLRAEFKRKTSGVEA
jgi:tyrosinase